MPVSWTALVAETVNGFIRPGSRNQPLNKTDLEIKKLLAVANINISMATFTFFRLAIGILMAAVFFGIGKIFLGDYVTATQLLFATFAGFLGVKPWDIAAGSLILTEAGGVCKTYANTDIEFKSDTNFVASNTDAVNRIIRSYIYDYFQEKAAAELMGNRMYRD